MWEVKREGVVCGIEKAVACLFTRRLTACVNMRWEREAETELEKERERGKSERNLIKFVGPA